MFVISYDIENDKVRSKVAKTLEDYGKRVQYSVFECHINNKQFEKLYSRLLALMCGEESGNIRIYHICMNCMSKISTIGINSSVLTPDEEQLFII